MNSGIEANINDNVININEIEIISMDFSDEDNN